jgi:nucleotide-binding universal stress UspA family protein
LHPTDYAETSRPALEYAVGLARDYQARLLLLHVVDSLGPENATYGEAVSEPQPEGYRQRLWEELHRWPLPEPHGPVEYLLAEGDPVEAIVRVAGERGCDLVVMGTHGRHGLKRLLAGSVAEEVVRDAPCPVLVVKSAPPRRPPPQERTEMHPGVLTEG